MTPAERRAALNAECSQAPDVAAAVRLEYGRSFEQWRATWGQVWDEDRAEPVDWEDWECNRPILDSYRGADGWRTASGRLHPVVWTKSRKIGATTELVLYLAWVLLYAERVEQHVIVAQQRDVVDDGSSDWSSSIMSKIRWVAANLPRWMLPESWQPWWSSQHPEDETPAQRKRQRGIGSGRPRSVSSRMRLSEPGRGAVILGVSTSPNRLRGLRAHRVWFDECAAIRRGAKRVSTSASDILLGQLWAAAAKVGPIFATSSIQGRFTYFGRLCHGEVIALGKRGDKGLLVERLHYSQHPRWNPTTDEGRRRIEEERGEMSDDQWAQEMEIDWSTSQVGRVWPAFARATHLLSEHDWSTRWRELCAGAPVVEAWDFGSGASLTCVVWAAYLRATDTVVLLDAASWHEATADVVARDVALRGWRTKVTPHGQLPQRRVGDIAGKARPQRIQGGRRVDSQASWIASLAEEGVRIEGRSLRIESAITAVGKALAEGRLLLAPACAERCDQLPTLVEALEGYHRQGPETPQDYDGHQTAPAKDVHSHLADAVQHVAALVWLAHGVA